MWLWFLCAALGQEVPDTSYELVVRSELRVSAARDQLHNAVRGLGYRKLVKFGQRAHYPHLMPWKGGIMVHEQGFARVHVPLFIPVAPGPGSVTAASVAIVFSHPRARTAYRGSVYDTLEPAFQELRDAIWAQEQAWMLFELPGELETVWETGHTSTGEVIGDPSARRDWLNEKLENTTDDANGAAVRHQIQVFIENHIP